MQCIACNSKNVGKLFVLRENPNFTIFSCKNCGLESLFPQPDFKTLDAIYNTDYYGSWGIKENYDNVKYMKQATFSWVLDKIKKYKRQGKLLDIGCATGFFMDIAQKRGFDVYGVDISKEAVEKAQKLFGKEKVWNSSIDDFYIQTKFDVIVMTDLLEHVFDPLKTLQQVKEFLVPGGIVVVLSPHAGSFSRKIMKKYWMQFKLEHLFYFTDKSIRSLAEYSGYHVLSSYIGIKKINFNYLFKQSKVYSLPVVSFVIKCINFILPLKCKNHNFSMKFGEKLRILKKSF